MCICVCMRDGGLYVDASIGGHFISSECNENEINCAIVIRTRRKTQVSNRLNVFKESKASLHTHDQLGPSFSSLYNKNETL